MITSDDLKWNFFPDFGDTTEAGKRRVLVVDDDVGIRESMKDILNDSNYEVDTAISGYEAIEMINGNHYSAVLMDINMPGLNGVDTFREMKKTEPEIKVIIVTAYATDGLLAEANKEGATGLYNKPVDIRKLLKFLDTLKNNRA